jgi:hypothetical protein
VSGNFTLAGFRAEKRHKLRRNTRTVGLKDTSLRHLSLSLLANISSDRFIMPASWGRIPM